MKIQQIASVGQAVFEVNREGAQVIITLDERLAEWQVTASAILALESSELVEFFSLVRGKELALNSL